MARLITNTKDHPGSWLEVTVANESGLIYTPVEPLNFIGPGNLVHFGHLVTSFEYFAGCDDFKFYMARALSEKAAEYGADYVQVPGVTLKSGESGENFFAIVMSNMYKIRGS